MFACALVLGACGQIGGNEDSKSPSTGSVGLALQVSPGVTVTNASYTITGPNAFATSGTLTVGTTIDVAFAVGPLPAGNGYLLTVNAVASDGVTTCEGTTPFDVMSGVSMTLVVHLVCRVPPRSGAVTVGFQTNVCPILDALGASPAEVLVGGIVTLTAVAHDPDGGPSAISFSWSATSGQLSSTSAPSPIFTCTATGSATITVVASDGDPGCADSLSLNVTCTAP